MSRSTNLIRIERNLCDIVGERDGGLQDISVLVPGRHHPLQDGSAQRDQEVELRLQEAPS